MLQSLHDREAIARFLSRQPEKHLYELGDLDDFFWPYTLWYGLVEDQEIQHLLLLYIGGTLPTLLCLDSNAAALVEASKNLLPSTFHAHLLPPYAPILAQYYRMQSFGPHYKYALHHPERLSLVPTSDSVRALTRNDLPALYALYEASYPGNWFDPRMLETGQYYGAWQDERLVSVAGIHVYSPRYNAATLGNVTTHPLYRGKGLALAVCAELCRSLQQKITHIGLNVKADNPTAISIYERLGFERVEIYEEFSCARR